MGNEVQVLGLSCCEWRSLGPFYLFFYLTSSPFSLQQKGVCFVLFHIASNDELGTLFTVGIGMKYLGYGKTALYSRQPCYYPFAHSAAISYLYFFVHLYRIVIFFYRKQKTKCLYNLVGSSGHYSFCALPWSNSSTFSAMARELVNPGLSIPKIFTQPL